MRLRNFWWLRLNGRGHKYVCPLLMSLSIIRYAMKGRKAYWRMGGLTASVVFSGDRKERVWEAPCLFPRSWIVAECAFWNSAPGLWLRTKGVGIYNR